ncbi:Methionine-R-sulfoxide reductase B3, mitochondrial [Myotis davidii]|uniref:L-methionine (R)-S-oxide reductase n=1 Tax=Myotis davidii TaxID=225400 RepID=L5LHR1_MYODS|nr:Methionine-R-sulfoxide reductase B3, mitochondrial [Myotis davidii]
MPHSFGHQWLGLLPGRGTSCPPHGPRCQQLCLCLRPGRGTSCTPCGPGRQWLRLRLGEGQAACPMVPAVPGTSGCACGLGEGQAPNPRSRVPAAAAWAKLPTHGPLWLLLARAKLVWVLDACGWPEGGKPMSRVPVTAWRREYWLLPQFFGSRFVGEDITVMSAFNLLHLVTKSQPVALRACGLPSGSCRDRKNCKVVFSQQELRKRLTPLQYHVTQEKGTESAFEGEYTHHKDPGIYKCVVCGTPLFKSETKFDSGSACFVKCGAHLGHIFDDGPRPTGKRYCINSASLSFAPAESAATGGRGAGSPAQADKAEL